MDRPDYRTKKVPFRGRFPTLVYQKDNTSCPLLALCNALLLMGEFIVDIEHGASISEGNLIDRICKYYMSKITTKGSRTKKTAMQTLKRLAQPIQCDMKLTSVKDMESSKELQLFEQLGVQVFHGNVVDPKEEELVGAIGSNTYSTLLAGVVSHRSKKDGQSHPPGSSRVDESAIVHLEPVQWDLLDDFFSKNPSQLTAYGFQSLKEHMLNTHTTLCVLFWNRCFHVVLELHGTLLLLQNSSDQFESTTVIWRYFDDINETGFFMDSKFVPPQTAVGATDLDGSCTIQKAGNVYIAKPVEFRGRRTFIVYPYMCGSSALVALCNAILLRGDVDLNKKFDVKLGLNLSHLHQVLVLAQKTAYYTCSPEEWIVAAGCLHQPVHVEMNFTNICNIKTMKQLDIFKNFGFELYHGFIADPENLELCNAIGRKYYDLTTGSPTSHLKAEARRVLVDEFLKYHDTEITSYGLRSLQEKLSETDLHVIFRNKQFHTAIKFNNRIFILDPNLRSFDEGKLWRSLEIVDGAGETLDIIPRESSRHRHKCDSPNCLLAFTSSFNLQRHYYAHPTSSGYGELNIVEHRAEFSKCWDSLSSEEAVDILSSDKVEFRKISGELVAKVLRQRYSEGGKVAKALLDIVNRSMEEEKITSAVLFAVLDEASEKTFLSSDIRYCKEETIWVGIPTDLLTEVNSFLACYSYLVEKALVDKWLQHKAGVAFQIGEDLIAAEKSMKWKKGDGDNIQGELQIPDHSARDLNSNSTVKPDGPSLQDNREVGLSLECTKDDSMDNLNELILEFLKSFRNHSLKKFYRGTVEAIKYMTNLDFYIHFPHIKEHSAELATYIIDHYDTDRVKSAISSAAVQYLIEHDLGISEEAIREGINVIVVDLPSPTSNMSFKKYARSNKLIRPYRIRKKFRGLFDLLFEGTLYVMTYAGRRAARGLMNYIVIMHKQNRSWRGEWKLSDICMRDGLFIIDKEALYVAEDEGMAEDFKMYFEVLNPYYVIVEQSSSYSTPYWEVLQNDTMKIPDRLKSPEEFARFHKYLSGHFAYMPPIAIFQFLSLLFNICDGLRPKDHQHYHPLNCNPKDIPEGWTLKAMGVYLFDHVFYYTRNGVRVNVYTDTYWHLLQYTRHFSSHVLSLTKGIACQEVRDMNLIHLMLACRLHAHLASLVRYIVKETNMQGLFFGAWQALLASDDKTEEEDLEASESDDEESGIAVEEKSSMHKEDEGELQDVDEFNLKMESEMECIAGKGQAS